MKIDIDRLTESELIELNNRIILRAGFLAQMRAHNAMMKFNVGNRVSFDLPDLSAVTGVTT